MKAVAYVAAAAIAATAVIAAPGQSVIIPTGQVAAKVDRGCLVRVVKGPYKSNLRSGKHDLPTGRYRVKVRPGTCVAKPKTIRVRKGKTVGLRVRNDPTSVPKQLVGAVTGSASVNGVPTARWQGDLVLDLNLPAFSSRTPGFETTASYRVSSLTGTYEIDATDATCTIKGAGQLGYADLLAEGEVAPLWSNPWQGFGYAMKVPFNPDRTWSATRSCADPASSEAVTRPPPPLLFSTNAWDGLTPVAPVPAGVAPTGTFVTTVGDITYTYTWSFTSGASTKLSKPA